MSTSDPSAGPEASGDESPPARNRAPIFIALGSLVALLVVVGLVAGLVSRAGPSGTPTAEQSATRAPLELPLRVNEMQRDPNANPQSAAPTPGSDLSTVTGVYNVEGTPNLVALAGRPVRDPSVMLQMVEARAVRQIGNGLCGREPSQDIDVCVVVKGDTAVLGGGLDDQPVEQIVAQAQAVLDAMPQ